MQSLPDKRDPAAVTMAFQHGVISVVGSFAPKSGAFYAVVVTDHGQYALRRLQN